MNNRLDSLRKIKFTAKFFDAWRIYWDALLEEAQAAGVAVSEADRRAMKSLYRLARLAPEKIGNHCGVTAERIIDAEIIAALAAGGSFIDAVQGTVDAAAVLAADAFVDAPPALEAIGIDPEQLEAAPLMTLLEAACETKHLVH